MNRLQKKCFIAAAGFHLLLLVILLIGPGFFAPRENTDDITILNYVPANLIDAKMNGGGNPKVTQPPAQATPTPPQPQPQPQPQQQPEPQEQKTLLQKILEPVTPKQPDIVPNLEKTTIKVSNDAPAKPAKPGISVDLTPVKRSASSGKKSGAKSDSSSQPTTSSSTISGSSIASRLRGQLSGSTEVSIPGPGGAAYANYADAVASIYYQAWILPDEATDDNSAVRVKITITRDGSVTAARITKPSGSAALNRSVQQTLNRVQSVAPFPDGAKDDERTFLFEFQPKFRKQIG
jgi:TonB family protein